MVFCFACSKEFDSSLQLTSHLSTHKFALNTTYKCVDCVDNFNSLSGLIKHLKNKHPLISIGAHVSDLLTNNPVTSTATFSSINRSFSFTDSEIETLIQNSKQTLDIYENDSNIKRITFFNCKFCEKIFFERNHIEMHIRQIHSRNQLSSNQSKPEKNTVIFEETCNFINKFKAAILILTLKFFSNENISRKQARDSLKSTFETYKMIINLFQYFSVYINDEKLKQEFDSLISYLQDFEFISEYKLFAELKKLGLLIEAYDYLIDQNEYLTGNVTKTNTHLMKIMPLRKLFTQLFEMKNFKEELIDHMESFKQVGSDTISNIIQSPLWLKKMSTIETTENTLYIPITTVKPVHNGIVGSRTKVRCRQVSVVYRFTGFCT
jgi:hypothetical protein